MSNQCASCEAPITWGRTANGAPAPYNLDDTPHHATCPDVESFSPKERKTWGWNAGPMVVAPTAILARAAEELAFQVTERQFRRGGHGPKIVKHDVTGIVGDLVPPGWAALAGAVPPERVLPKPLMMWPRAPRELRPYQTKALDALLAAWAGTLVAPCGAGKTVIGVQLILVRSLRTLVLVHTKDLQSQWEREIELVLGVGAPVKVDTFQRLARTKGQIAGYDMVIADEAHHTPAATFLDVLQRIPCWYRYGLTATPDRDDGYTRLMHWWLGPIVHEITHEETGALRPRIYPLLTEWDWAPVNGELDWTGMMTALLEDEGRNWWVAYTIQRRDAIHRGTHLIITTRKAHVQVMADLIHMVTQEPVAAITSDLTKKPRTRILDRVRSGEIRFLVATQLADEGLDVPVIDTVWLVSPSASRGRTIQRVGRALRPVPGKNPPVVFDLVDVRVAALKRQWAARKRVHAKIGDVRAPRTLEEVAS